MPARPALIIGSMVKVMPGSSLSPVPRAPVVQDLRLLVELPADAVAAELAHDREAVGLCESLDACADVAEVRAGAHRADAPPHRLVGDVDQPLRLDRRRPDEEHAAGVAVKAVLDDGDVDVDDVAGLEPLVAGDAVADDLVDRRADRRRVGTWPGGA